VHPAARKKRRARLASRKWPEVKFSELATGNAFTNLTRVRFAFAFLLLSLALTGQPAIVRLAYFGNLQGQIAIPEIPPLTWTLGAPKASDGRQTATFSLSGQDIELRASIHADEKSGVIHWRIETGRLVLGPWINALAARYAPALASTSATGEVTISGDGHLEGFKPVGRFSLACANALVSDASQGWTLEGVSLAGDFSLGADFAIASAGPLELGIRTITTSRLGARAFSMTARLENFTSLAVETARIEIAGGEVDSTPFTLPLSPLSIQTRVRIKRIGLQDFAQLIPSGLAEARGRLDGELVLGWDQADGLRLGIGHLSLDEFEPTIFRLAASPGFLTSHIPVRLSFLPGRIGEWLSFRNNAYDDMSDIEMGRTELAVKSLRVALTPDGDAAGRSARVFIDASPVQKNGSVKQIVFNINVAGPLSQLLNIGMNEDFSAKLR
jgi:hypothetical protein